MKNIIIFVQNKYKKVDVLMKNKICWYDTLKKEMQTFEGGKLEFEYREDPYLVSLDNNVKLANNIKSNFRMLPKVVGLFEKKNIECSFVDFVKDFLQKYSNQRGIDLLLEESGNELICSIDDEYIDDISFDLERNNIDFEIL